MTRPLLPNAATPDVFDALRRDEMQLRPGAEAVCARLGHGSETLDRFPEGSLPVYAVGDTRVLKLYPPCFPGERDREMAALRALEGRLPVPTPTVEAAGEAWGWEYLLMERLRGVGLAAAWPRIPDEDRLRLAGTLGEALRVLHGLGVEGLDVLRSDWNAFLAGQRDACVERQRRLGLAERWLEQIPGFLAGTPLGEHAGSLLHTEVMREHLLVLERPEGWILSGLFDLEPAMVGAPEYEFASVGLFVTCGDPRLLHRVLTAYGYPGDGVDAALQRRFLAYALLHRYSNLPWYVDRLPPPAGARSLDDLAAHWWALP